MAGQRLSLCVIARNEEAALPGCLSSAVPVVDEVIVVDTGSTDTTVSVAQRMGATVIHHPWRDDFSDARNVAAAAATGDWLLVLDADEHLAPGAGPTLRAAMQQEDVDVYVLPLVAASRLDASVEEVLQGSARLGESVQVMRLVRNVDTPRWEGPIHEHLGTWLAHRSDRIALLECPIVHYGGIPSVRDATGRSARNLALLRRRCETHPEDLSSLCYLTHALVLAGETAEAGPVLERAWNLAVTRMVGRERPLRVANLAAFRAESQFAGGMLNAAIATLERAWSWGIDHPNLDYVRGILHEVQAEHTRNRWNRGAHLRQARERYERVVSQRGGVFPEEVMVGITGAEGWNRLGTVLLQLEDGAGALAAFDRSLAEGPSEPAGPALGRVEALLLLGRAEEAECALAPYLCSLFPDAGVLSDQVDRALGREPDLLKHVFGRAGRAFLAPHRRRLGATGGVSG